MRTRTIRICGIIAVCCGVAAWSHTVMADGPTENLGRASAPLVNAGIKLDDDSLIKALKHEDATLGSRAAYILGRRPKTAAIIAGLAEAAAAKNETLAVAAMQSLERLGDRSWSGSAKERLGSMTDRALQIQTASLLAGAGIGDGWDVVAAAIADPGYGSLALGCVDAFDGKARKNGDKIDVRAELQRLLTSAPAEIKRKIQAKLEALPAKTE